jgi:histidinol-phosphatase (PHP family)
VSLNAPQWMVSLHGGHSADFCDHATGTLREIIETAAALGFHTYGTAEHAPRYLPEHVFAEETAMGWDLDRLARNFDAYARESARLTDEFADRISLLRGFETEVVPADRYREITLGLRKRYAFDYIVGSVHWVEGIIIDYTQAEFDRAVRQCGGSEPFAVRYYETVREMVTALKPEVVAHLDVIRKFTVPESATDTPAIRKAAARALEAIRECGSILDINTAALRKGLSAPFPAPWLLQLATRDFGIPVCFGDDSHNPAQVGKGIPEAREYLLDNGVTAITTLARSANGLNRETVALL